jgi:hypothetical protein
MEHSRRDRKKPCEPGKRYGTKRTTEQVKEDFFDPNIVHPITKTKTYGTLYKETLARDEKIRNLGYKLVTIWEHEWNEINSEDICQPCSSS